MNSFFKKFILHILLLSTVIFSVPMVGYAQQTYTTTSGANPQAVTYSNGIQNGAGVTNSANAADAVGSARRTLDTA